MQPCGCRLAPIVHPAATVVAVEAGPSCWGLRARPATQLQQQLQLQLLGTGKPIAPHFTSKKLQGWSFAPEDSCMSVTSSSAAIMSPCPPPPPRPAQSMCWPATAAGGGCGADMLHPSGGGAAATYERRVFAQSGNQQCGNQHADKRPNDRRRV